ncbi:hypothetical protein TeGR_g513 [Tetraparma gracilis]|uniref:OsmC-like protein n=1 Tax=Tetraparma gracilis TaxID=2962635 RepID=A0ABQ6N9B0_9STRA|nr:hypothetical protein TeGR_g513 [Tetraparma gracilis]
MLRSPLLRCLSTSPRPKLYSLTCTSPGPTSSSLTSTGHAILTDLPRASGGENSHPEPVYLLLASLVSCEAATASYVLRQLSPRLSLRSPLRFSVRAERDERGSLALPIGEEPGAPAMLRRVWGTVEVSTTPAITDEQVEVLGRQVGRRCPVADMMKRAGVELDVRFVRGE